LGGNSKTTLIVTCSPHPNNLAETISTLRFGISAKKIKNTPKINK
jgi:kinesin family protein 5